MVLKNGFKHIFNLRNNYKNKGISKSKYSSYKSINLLRGLNTTNSQKVVK